MNTTADEEDTRHDEGGDSDGRCAIAVGHGNGYQRPDTYKAIFAHVSPPGHEEIDGTCYEGHDDGPGFGFDAVPLDADQPGRDIGEQGDGDPAGVKAERPPDRCDDS